MNTGNMTMVYGAVAMLSVLLLIGYLLSYVLIMVAMIWYAAKKQRISSFKYTILLFVAVLLNIGV